MTCAVPSLDYTTDSKGKTSKLFVSFAKLVTPVESNTILIPYFTPASLKNGTSEEHDQAGSLEQPRQNLAPRGYQATNAGTRGC